MLEVLEYPNVENNIKYERRITPCLLTNHNLTNLFRQRIIGRELHRVHFKLYPLDMQTKILSLNLIPKSKPKPHPLVLAHCGQAGGYTRQTYRHAGYSHQLPFFVISCFWTVKSIPIAIIYSSLQLTNYLELLFLLAFMLYTFTYSEPPTSIQKPISHHHHHRKQYKTDTAQQLLLYAFSLIRYYIKEKIFKLKRSLFSTRKKYSVLISDTKLQLMFFFLNFFLFALLSFPHIHQVFFFLSTYLLATSKIPRIQYLFRLVVVKDIISSKGSTDEGNAHTKKIHILTLTFSRSYFQDEFVEHKNTH